MATKWKNVLISWIKCYDYNVKEFSELTDCEILSKIITRIEYHHTNPHKTTKHYQRHVQHFIQRNYPDIVFEGRDFTSENDCCVAASLILHHVCTRCEDPLLRNLMADRLTGDTPEQIIVFTKSLFVKRDIAYGDVRAAIIDACGEDALCINEHRQTTSGSCTSITPPLMRILHERSRDVKQLQAALEAERFDKSFLQDELNKVLVKLEKTTKEKDDYQKELCSLKYNSLTDVPGDTCEGDSAANTSDIERKKLNSMIIQLEDRLSNVVSSLDDLTQERDRLKLKVEEIKVEREKWLSRTQEEITRSNKLSMDLEEERLLCSALQEQVSELRAHFNRGLDKTIECDDPDGSVVHRNRLGDQSSICEEACVAVVEVQLREERAKIVELSTNNQQLLDQVKDMETFQEKVLQKLIKQKELLEKQIAACDSMNENMNTKLETLVNVDSQVDIGNATTTFDRNNEIIEQLYNTLILTIEELNKELTNSKDIVKQQEASLKKSKKELERFFSKQEELVKCIEGKVVAYDQHTVDLKTKYNQKLDTFSKQIDQLKSLIEFISHNLNQVIQDKDDKINKLNGQIESISKDRLVMEMMFADEKFKLNAAIEMGNNTIEKLNNLVQDEIKEKQQLIDKYNKESSTLKNDLDNAMMRLMSVQEQNGNLIGIIDSKEQEISKAKDKASHQQCAIERMQIEANNKDLMLQNSTSEYKNKIQILNLEMKHQKELTDKLKLELDDMTEMYKSSSAENKTLRSDITSLRCCIRDLHLEKEDLNTQKLEYNNKTIEMKIRIDLLSKSLTEANIERERMITELSGKIEELNDIIIQVSSDKNKLQEALEELTFRHNEVEASRSNLLMELESVTKCSEDLAKANDLLQRGNEELKTTVSQLNNVRTDLNNNLKERDNKIKSLEMDLESKNKTLIDTIQNMSMQSVEIEKLEDKNTKICNLNTLNREKISTLTMKLDEQGNTMQQLNEKIKELENNVVEATKRGKHEVENLNETLYSYKKQIDELNENLGDKCTKINELEYSLTELNKYLEQVVAEKGLIIIKSQTEMNELEDCKKKLMNSISDHAKKIEVLEFELEEKNQLVADLKQEISTLETDLIVRIDEKGMLDVLISEKDKTISTQGKEIGKLEAECRKYIKDLELSNYKCFKWDNDFSILLKEKAAVDVQLNELQLINNNLDKELKEKEAKITKLHSEIQSLLVVVSEKDFTISNMINHVKKCEEELVEYKEKLENETSSFETNKKRNEAVIKNLNEMFEKTSKNLEELKESTSKEINMLQITIREQQKCNDVLKKQVDNMKCEYNTIEQQLCSSITNSETVSKERDSLKAQNVELLKQNTGAGDCLKDMTKDMKTMIRRVESIVHICSKVKPQAVDKFYDSNDDIVKNLSRHKSIVAQLARELKSVEDYLHDSLVRLKKMDYIANRNADSSFADCLVILIDHINLTTTENNNLTAKIHKLILEYEKSNLEMSINISKILEIGEKDVKDYITAVKSERTLNILAKNRFKSDLNVNTMWSSIEELMTAYKNIVCEVKNESDFLKQCIDNYDAKIKILEDDNTSKSQELVDLQQQLKNMAQNKQLEINKLKDELISTNKDKSDLECVLYDKSKELLETQKELAYRCREYDDIATKHDEQLKTCNQLCLELTNMRDELLTKNEDLKKSEKFIDELEKSYVENEKILSEKIVMIEDALIKKDVEIKDSQMQNNELKAQLVEMEMKHSAMVANLENIMESTQVYGIIDNGNLVKASLCDEEKILDKNDMYSGVCNKIVKLLQFIKDLVSKNEIMSEDISAKFALIESLEENIAKAEVDNERIDKLNKDLKNENKSLIEKNKSLEKHLKMTKESLLRADMESKENEGKYEKVKIKVDELEKHLDAEKTRLFDLSTTMELVLSMIVHDNNDTLEMENLLKTIDEIEIRFDHGTLKNSITDLLEKFAKLKETNRELHNVCEMLKVEKEGKIKMLTNEVAALSNSIMNREELIHNVKQGRDMQIGSLKKQVDILSSDLIGTSEERNSAINNLETIVAEKTRVIATLQSDISYLKSMMAESETKLLDVGKELEASKENYEKLSNHMRKIVNQKNENIAELENKIVKAESNANQIVKLSAKYQAIIQKRITDLKSGSGVLKELTHLTNISDSETRKSITLNDLERFLEYTEKCSRNLYERCSDLQQKCDHLQDVVNIKNSEKENVKRYLTDLLGHFRTMLSVKDAYYIKLNKIVQYQGNVRKEINNLQDTVSDSVMVRLENGYSTNMSETIDVFSSVCRWIIKCIERTVTEEKIKQVLRNEMPIFSATDFQNTGLEVQVDELQTGLRRVMEDMTKAKKGELQGRSVNASVMEVKAEYEEKLNRMKGKMKQLYQEQIMVYREKQKDEIASMQRKLDYAQKLLAERTKAYEDHISGLTKELWTVGEKLLMEKDQAEWLKRRQHSSSLMSLQHLHSSGLTNTRRDSEFPLPRPSDAMSLRSVAGGIKTKKNDDFLMEDEEGEVFDNRWLKELRLSPNKSNKLNTDERLSELKWRNSLCPPHLKSSYPAETQFHLGKPLNEDEIKLAKAKKVEKLNLLRSQRAQRTRETKIFCSLSTNDDLRQERRSRKEVGITAYKKPGPPTPSKAAGRLSATDMDLRDSIRMEPEPNGSRKTSTPSRLRALFKSNRNESENGPSTPRSKRLSIFRKQPR